ncbi:SDR family NAD(P)-dependent oxidoreductase [Spirillospora sp. NPDC048911]|uniref:SDR family NAD(P)-dependent oxidoreductase n=1 Tax=Spirillospora sp. NPDC048911 TaxID=3364527 RepID=UPI00370F99E9
MTASSSAQPSGTPGGERVIVVAGAGGAAGNAVVRALAASGARVVAADRIPREWDDERISPVVVDLLDAAATRAWAGAVVAEHGRVDGLIHLVGGWRGGTPFAETDLADWAFLHDLLVRTLQHTTLAFHEHLARSPYGRVAIVSQHSAQRPAQDMAAYSTAKAAAEAWILAQADAFGTTAAASAGADDVPVGTGDAPVGNAAATILVVKALLTDAMLKQSPDDSFPGFTHVDDLAQAIADLWTRPAEQLNGRRLDLSHS